MDFIERRHRAGHNRNQAFEDRRLRGIRTLANCLSGEAHVISQLGRGQYGGGCGQRHRSEGVSASDVPGP